MDEPTRRFFKLGPVSEVPHGSARVFTVAGKRIAVCNVEGKIYAIDDRCTHDNGPLGEGELIGCEIECPRHGARFDVRTGKALCLPGVGAVETFSVDVRDEQIFVGVPVNA